MDGWMDKRFNGIIGAKNSAYCTQEVLEVTGFSEFWSSKLAGRRLGKESQEHERQHMSTETRAAS